MGYYRNECGIYKITNITNKKVYIGSSVSVRERMLTHKNSLINNSHYNRYLQRSWNKYGLDSFIFEIIELTEKNELIKREQYYVDMYKSSNSKYGYNINEVVNSPIGRKLTLDSRRNVSIAHGGKLFYVFKKSTKELVGEWVNQSECADELNIESKCISRCLNNKAKSVGEFIFLRHNDINNINFDYYNEVQHSNTKKFNVYNYEDNEYIGTWLKQSDCAKDLNLSRNRINLCLNNKIEKYKSYIFIYIDN